MDFELKLSELLEHLLGQTRPPCPGNLAEAIRYSLLAPGKRIRPRLSLAAGEAAGLDGRAAFSCAAAIEMIHCFTLIHDDLPCMDNDDFRRGRPSNHKAHGEGMALLAGDALIGLSFEALGEAAPHVTPASLVAAFSSLAHAIGPRGVTGGQAAETMLATGPTMDSLESMHAQKTGALFVAAAAMPTDLAGIAPTSDRGRTIREYALALGLAFQTIDDLDDADQDRRDHGKFPPTQILHYLDAQTARERAIERLTASLHRLESAWGANAGSLKPVASELLKKL